MAHYTGFPQDGMAAIPEFGPRCDPDEKYLASAYELADHNFQPVTAPTQPNVLTALNGNDHGWVYNNLEPGTPMIIISPYARHGVYHQQSTNVSILSFMQKLWGLPALTPLNARQNNLFSAFNFSQAPLAPPAVPVAPADTIGFHGSGGIFTDVGGPTPRRSVTTHLRPEP